MRLRKNDDLSELKCVLCNKSHKIQFDFKNCLKHFTFWLITSVGKNNYRHMVCGHGFRRIKSLLCYSVTYYPSLKTKHVQ